MERKVFLSFLGGSNYNPCQYRFPNGFISPELKFIQEATLLQLEDKDKWTSSDVAFILLTDSAKAKNWEDNGQRNRDGEIIPAEGLGTRLKKAGLNMKIEPVCNVPECNDANDIMTLFSLIFNLLKEGDVLYLDLTHGYRYMPMLMLVLSSYSKFLKNIEVRSITYGNFEGVDRSCPVKPVIDLLPLASLLDWTFAAGQYVKSGNVDELVRLSNEELTPILKESRGNDDSANKMRGFIKCLSSFIDERRFCRGKDIILSTAYNKLDKYIEEVKTSEIIPALTPIVQKINSTFDGLNTTENLRNGYVASKWCFDNGLYQQAVTILFENIVSEICIEAGLDWKNKTDREFIAAAKTKLLDTGKDVDLPATENAEEKLQRVMDTSSLKRRLDDYKRLSEIRNNINHSGMNDKNLKIMQTKTSLAEIINNCLKYDAD